MTKLLKELYLYKSMGFSYIDDITVPTTKTGFSNTSWSEVEAVVNNCFLCELSKSRKNIVFGNGNKKAKVMFVGEAPGILEDEIGNVLVGKSGELLTKMIENVLNISKNEAYITNILKCKTPSNAKVTTTQINSCKDYLNTQINLVSPKLIVTLGEVAYNHLAKADITLDEARAKVSKYNNITLIPTYHPSYLLRNPSAKAQAFQDLLKVKSFLQR